MACTGGWDWAPISNTYRMSESVGKTATFSFGVWKGVSLVSIPPGDVSIEHVVPVTRFLGAYPTARIEEGAHEGFNVTVTVHVWAARGGAAGSMQVQGAWGGATATTGHVNLPGGRSSVSVALHASAEQTKLWWPNGMGEQVMYNITAQWMPASAGAGAEAGAGAGAGAVGSYPG